MEVFIFYWLTGILAFSDQANDPVQAAWSGRQAGRQFECQRLSQADAHQLYPGRVPAPSARASVLMQIDALVCQRRVAPDGEREPREARILDNLQQEVGELVALAATEGDDDTHWYVDAFYPDATMARKISTASRTALAERGHWVSDQAPLLAAGDIEVLHAMPMRDAIPLACKRLFAEGTLKRGDAMIAVALLHPKESQLHAGACRAGEFRWLR